MTRAEQIERADAISAEYHAGASQSELARKYRVSIPAISRLLGRYGARLSQAETKSRCIAAHASRAARNRAEREAVR